MDTKSKQNTRDTRQQNTWDTRQLNNGQDNWQKIKDKRQETTETMNKRLERKDTRQGTGDNCHMKIDDRQEIWT